jgi:Domain of unknown function (DUF4175)
MDYRSSELVEVIRRVRNRWRLKLALRGAVIVVAGTVLALLLSASGLESFRFSAPAIISFRIITVAVFVGLLFYGLVWPLRRRVSDAQVAMYLEERDPTLEAAIISAVEATADGGSPAHSPRLVEKLVEQAIDQCRALDDGRVVERTSVQRHAASLAAIAAIVALVIAFGPAYLRHGLSALLIISRSAEASTPYKIEVQPGSAKVPRGADQAVRARLIGFTSSDVSVMMRNTPNAAFERVPLIPSKDPGQFEGMLFHLEKPTEYYVESNGVRSERFSLAVVELPTVQQLDLEYRFPAYTGLEPRKAEGGDVAAIRGTEVVLHVTPTMTTPDGKIRLSDGGAMPLTRQADGTLTGSFKIAQQGFYRIELTGPHGEKVDASPQYTIDVIDDQPPSVHFTKPGRDTQASPVEELFLEARADDDYGVKSLQLFYSVNGSTPKSINLFGGSRPLPEVSAGHTIYLEELGLKPGDFVSYYAKASDTDAVQGSKTTTSDIYFVQIRPFKKDYKPAQSQAQGGGGGGGGGGQQVGQLSQQQREIVAATFNIVRDKAKTKPDKYRENVVFLNLAQAKLREQVEELVTKLKSRLGVVDPSFNTIAEVLPKAAEEMKAAESELKGLKADSALSPEQRALKLLQEAEQQYELQVAQQQGGGGGGGGNTAMAEDLADLFELELDKLANQYEMQQRAEQQQGDQQIDQLVEKLKELARRQQQELERQRRMAQAGQSGSGNSSAAQRELAEQVEQMKRQLQQLTRNEQQRQQLNDAMQKLQDAANAMRQAAANGSKDGGAQANQALDRLREAQQRLERNQSGRGDRDLQRAQRQAEELANEQKEVATDVNSLDQAQPGPGRDAKAKTLSDRKEAMDAKVADLQQQLEKLANQMRKDEKDAARRLDEAAGSIRDKRIREKIRYTQRVIQQGGGSQQQYARGMEDDIGANLDALQKKIGDAASAVGRQSKQDSLARAADKTRDLVRGMESLDQRMRDRAQQGKGQQGKAQQGQQGQNGKSQQGQQGQQGQNGGQQGQQSAGGQQGGGNANDGANAGSPTRDGGYYGGDARNWGGYGYGWRWNPDDIRQFRNQWREWANDAEALRRQLQQSGMSPRDLEEVLRDLRQFDNDRVYADPQGLEKLQAAAIEKLKKFEFSLRRKVDNGNDSLSLSGSDQVPEGFRQAIEEYYRSLAKKPAQQVPQR